MESETPGSYMTVGHILASKIKTHEGEIEGLKSAAKKKKNPLDWAGVIQKKKRPRSRAKKKKKKKAKKNHKRRD